MSKPKSNAGQGAPGRMTNEKPDEPECEIDVELVSLAELKPAEAKAATDEDDEVQLAELVKPAPHVRPNDTVRLADSAEPTRVNLPDPSQHEPAIRSAVPDWLGDVKPAVKASKSPLNAIPNWMADVAEIEASTSSSGGQPIASIGWLADIGKLENMHAGTPLLTSVDAAQSHVQDSPPLSPASPTESSTKAFYDARNALAKWVDDDCRRSLILTADLEELKKHPGIKAILAQFGGYGPLMREKLISHLEFLAQNRRKHYAARAK
jgi:hypothetical protein